MTNHKPYIIKKPKRFYFLSVGCRKKI